MSPSARSKRASRPGTARRFRIQPYLTKGLHQRFAAHCAAVGVTESAVTEAALAQYLDRTSDQALLMRRIDRLGRALERTDRDLQIFSEAFAAWVQIWFAHSPEIPTADRDSVRRESSVRYQKFIDYVASKLGGGRRFVDLFSKEHLTDEASLSAAAQAGTPSTPEGPQAL